MFEALFSLHRPGGGAGRRRGARMSRPSSARPSRQRAAALLAGALRAARAVRAFLAGFTDMPAARLDAPCATCGGTARRVARDALAARRPSY
jgi:hypothetical protein